MSKKVIRSLNCSISHTGVSNRSKHDLPIYVHPFKVESYNGTEGCTENQNYRVVVKVNGKAKTISYHSSKEIATEVSKAVKVLTKLHKEEMKVRLAEMLTKTM